MTVVIEVEDDAGIEKAIEQVVLDTILELESTDLVAPLKTDVMPKMEEWHREYFVGQHDPDGAKWAALSPATVKAKGHSTILVHTNALRQSLTENSDGSYRDVGGDESQAFLSFGTTVEYAHWHMTGTANMPARPHTGLSEERCDEIAGIIADSIIKAVEDKQS